MKLSEKTLAEMVEAGYSWADFESREESLQGIDAAKAEGDTKREMDDTLKLTYLAEKEERSIVDVESMHVCDFHSFELTSFARLAYAHGSCSWNDRATGAIDYDRSYDDIRVLIEDMGDICAVYIKDYGFGYIKLTFGNWLYVVLYIIWIVAIWFHLSHGFWSAMHTLGWNGKIWQKRWQCIGLIYTTVLMLGFLVVVLAFAFKCAPSLCCTM